MRQWRNLLGGLLLWTSHFFALYIIASVFPGTATAKILVLGVTLLLLGTTVFLATRAFNRLAHIPDNLDRWINSLAILVHALSGIAIIYQAMPAALS